MTTAFALMLFVTITLTSFVMPAMSAFVTATFAMMMLTVSAHVSLLLDRQFSLPGSRQREDKRRAASLLALDLNLAPVRLNPLLRDGKSQACGCNSLWWQTSFRISFS
jgi:energy-coupling factor transporter transmembrane protein EcfT